MSAAGMNSAGPEAEGPSGAARGHGGPYGDSPISLRSIILGMFLLVFTGVYFFLATSLIHQVNQNRLKSDQEHNMRMAERAMERQFEASRGEIGVNEVLWRYLPHYTDGVVSPLWPWIAGRFAVEDHEEFFVRGKWFHVVCTAVFCLILALWTSRFFTLPATMTFVCLAGFGALLPRAVFFQPEPIYFVLFFLCWVCCIRIIRRNALWLYGLLGALLGLAYLSKSSIQPLVLVFVAFSTIHFLELMWIQRRKGKELEAKGRWVPQNHFVGLVLLGVMFLVVTGARLHYSHQAYGSAFHTYPSYWMWMDNFDEGVAFMQAHPNRETLGAIPGEEKPSLINYLKSHTAEENRERLTEGFVKEVRGFLLPKRVRQQKGGEVAPWKHLLPRRGHYLGVLLVLLCGMVIASWGCARNTPGWKELDIQSGRVVAAFVLGTALLYTASYGWYARIGRGDRFMMSLYLPLAFSLIWGTEAVLRRMPPGRARACAGGVYRVAHVVLLGFLGWRLCELIENPLFGK